MSSCRVRTILKLLITLGSTHAVDAKTVATNTSFGAIELVQEVRTRDPGEPEVMHVATEWTKLRLLWASQAGDMTVRLEDDGEMLDIYVAGHDCLSRAPFQRYRNEIGEPALWNSVLANMRNLMSACPRVSASQSRSYTREISNSADDFVPAVEALKSRTHTVFRSDLKRCRPKQARPNEPILHVPFANVCDGRW